MNKPSLPSFLLIVFLVLVLAGQGFAAGYVLCAGENGNLAVEKAFGAGCVTQERQLCAVEAIHHDAEGHQCGDCEDHPLALQELHGGSRIDRILVGSDVFDPDFSVAQPAFPTPYVRDLTPGLLPQPPPRPSLVLVSLRTIILLI